jgi:hypothetical protein
MAMLVITRGYWNCHYPIIPKAINQPVCLKINRGFLNTTRIEIRYTVCVSGKHPVKWGINPQNIPSLQRERWLWQSLTILRFQHPIWLGHEQQHLWKSAWGPCEFCQGIHPVCQVESFWDVGWPQQQPMGETHGMGRFGRPGLRVEAGPAIHAFGGFAPRHGKWDMYGYVGTMLAKVQRIVD